MSTVIRKFVPERICLKDYIHYSDEDGYVGLIPPPSIAGITRNNYFLVHARYNIVANNRVLDIYGPGTYVDGWGTMFNKNKLLLRPYTVFIWRKNFIAHGWIKGVVNLFIRHTLSCIYHGKEVFYDQWELLAQFQGTDKVIILLRESNWQEAVKLITNDKMSRQHMFKKMMEE